MEDKETDQISKQLTGPASEKKADPFQDDKNFPYPAKLWLQPCDWTKFTPQYYDTIIKVISQGLDITRDRHLPIKKEYDALPAEERERRKDESQSRLELIAKTMADFRESPQTIWMFDAAHATLFVNPEDSNDIFRKKAALCATIHAFEITAYLVKRIDQKLIDEPYLKEKDGFYDFEEYVESGQQTTVLGGRPNVHYRLFPQHCVEMK